LKIEITEPERERERERAMVGLMQVPYDATVRLMLSTLERNLLPDAVIRKLTRLLLAGRLRSGYKPSSELQLSDLLQFVLCNPLSFSFWL
jgi:hypothetical protein